MLQAGYSWIRTSFFWKIWTYSTLVFIVNFLKFTYLKWLAIEAIKEADNLLPEIPGEIIPIGDIPEKQLDLIRARWKHKSWIYSRKTVFLIN